MNEEKEENEKKEERKISEKQIKVVIFVVIIIMVIFIAVWGMVPQKIYEIEEVLNNSAEFNGTNISVKGVVANWSSQSDNFTIKDAEKPALIINITYTGQFPEGFKIGETVVVDGLFNSTDGVNHVLSTSIQIGCPSKY